MSSLQPSIFSDMVEVAAKAFADATGYYVPFHRGLSSESADNVRRGMRAALLAAADAERPTREQLLKALRVALALAAPHEPGDSRMVSDEFVACSTVAAGQADAASMAVIDAALADQEG